jgi:predicted dehydrogenase
MSRESFFAQLKQPAKQPAGQPVEQPSECSRRRFLGGALAAAALGPVVGDPAAFAAGSPAADVEAAPPKRKIKLGLVGCGNRGGWIAPLFRQHGGYEMHAVADYFQPLADACGDAVGVDKRRRFSGLSSCQKVIESGVEAIALETPPAFFPEQAAAAIAAGLHVYIAKPVAVDVPGCLKIEAAGREATRRRRVFLVDYQIPTDPGNIEVARRIRVEEGGKLAAVSTVGQTGGHVDPPRKATIEDLLPNRWANYLCLGGGWIVSFDIHAIDAAMWVIGERPVAAMGDSRICRSNPHGDSPDATAVTFEYAGGLIHNHWGQALPNAAASALSCKIYSETAHACLTYGGPEPATFERRHHKPFRAEVKELYRAGAKRNIAAFYRAVTELHTENSTVERAVDGCLTAILGREAAARHSRLSMRELLAENKAIELDLSGLKV